MHAVVLIHIIYLGIGGPAGWHDTKFIFAGRMSWRLRAHVTSSYTSSTAAWYASTVLVAVIYTWFYRFLSWFYRFRAREACLKVTHAGTSRGLCQDPHGLRAHWDSARVEAQEVLFPRDLGSAAVPVERPPETRSFLWGQGTSDAPATLEESQRKHSACLPGTYNMLLPPQPCSLPPECVPIRATVP